MAKKILDKITVNFSNCKEGQFDIASDYVRFHIYRLEYESVYKVIKPDMDEINEENADVNVWTCDDSILDKHFGKSEKGVLSRDDFKKKRQEALAIQSQLDALKDKGITLENFDGMNNVDKIFITLGVHRNIQSVNLDKALLSGCDLKKVVETYYKKSGTGLKDTKSALKSAFQKTVGQEGTLFYGVKLKASDFSDNDVKNFLAVFGGKDKVVEKKKKDVVISSNLQWVEAWNNEKTIATAVTRLFAVCLDKSKNYEVIRPEKVEPEAVEPEKVEAVA